MKKKKGGGGGGANWMDTYGDMVTLLLCFFVLLYSMSTIDEAKWKAIVQSFNPNAVFTEDMNIGGGEGPFSDPEFDQFGSAVDIDKAALEAEMEAIAQALQELFETMSSYAEENGMSDSITITQGDGYVFISFNDAVFFGGDSAVLLPRGQEVLDVLCGALDKAVDYIDEVRVMGHTAQADETRPNNPEVDRSLSAQRATNAVIYIQTHSTISGARLISEGYGQWRPVSPNTDDAHRSYNRRVEIKITGLDLLNQMGDSIQQYTTMRSGGTEEAAETAEAAETGEVSGGSEETAG